MQRDICVLETLIASTFVTMLVATFSNMLVSFVSFFASLPVDLVVLNTGTWKPFHIFPPNSPRWKYTCQLCWAFSSVPEVSTKACGWPGNWVRQLFCNKDDLLKCLSGCLPWTGVLWIILFTNWASGLRYFSCYNNNKKSFDLFYTCLRAFWLMNLFT